MLTDENKHLTFGKKYSKNSPAEKLFFNKSENTKKDQITRTK